MTTDFSIITELESVRQQKSHLSERERELSQPLLTSLHLIPTLFQWYCELQGHSGLPERRAGTRFRQKFIFIILFLYSPSALAGGKITKGVRDVLAEVLGFRSPTAISNLCVNVMFYYHNYKDYREDVDCLFTQILARIKINGLISGKEACPEFTTDCTD